MTFTRRRLDLKFQLGQGDFGKAGFDTIEVKGLRASVSIVRAGGFSMSEMDLRVYGLSLDVMNKLTILNQLRQYDSRRNVVTVSAGDDSGTSVCFIGNIISAIADISGPDASMVFHAASGYVDLIQPVTPTSYKGAVDVATVLAGLAARMTPTLVLENSGVSVTLSNPYLPGTLLDQIRAVASAANINCVIDDVQQRLAIWPEGGVRNGLNLAVGPDTGMVGYPVYTQNGIQLTMLYNPSLAFGMQLAVRSQLLPASGGWSVASVTHELESETPGGKWFSMVECGLIGQAVPIIT